jgi:hypothetical protein
MREGRQGGVVGNVIEEFGREVVLEGGRRWARCKRRGERKGELGEKARKGGEDVPRSGD